MPSYVIVGASRGIGYEWLNQLSKDPSNTVIGLVRSISSTQAKLTTDSITNVHLLTGDMTSPASLSLAASSAEKLLPNGVDYLIVNGAFTALTTASLHPSAFHGREEELASEMTASLNVNVLGVIYSVNAFLPLVRKGKEKKITVISSGMADTELVVKEDIGGSVVYASMKAATNVVVAKYAVELRGEGITLLALSPGVVATQENLTEEEGTYLMALGGKLVHYNPEFKGPITTTESVIAQKKVIEDITLEQTGAFISHLGSKQWV